MEFQSKYCSGRNLTADELQILDLIDNHSYSALHFGSLGALHSKVTVEIHDKDSKDYTVEYSIEELQKELEETQTAFNDNPYNGKNSVLRDDLGSRIGFLSRLLENNEGKSGTIKETVTNDLLGLYDGQIKVVKLFTDNIDKNVACVAMTYVHEMMHAYFDTTSAIEKIEEPIVEYCTLKFLEDFVSHHTSYDYILEYANKSIKKKKYALGIAHYGFGHYLYDCNTIDWMSLYKKANNKIGPSNDLNKYKSCFNGLYPFSSELGCQDLLYRILMQANGAKQVTSPFKLGCTNCPISLSKRNNIPCFKFDQAFKTLCLNGVFENNSEVVKKVITKSLLVNQIDKLYLGPQFYMKDNFLSSLIRRREPKINIDKANNNYRLSNGMLLTYDGKTLLYASGSVVIPQTVEKIAARALENVTNITLHDDFARIEDIDPDLRQFITISQNHNSLKTDKGLLLSKNGKTLYSCPKDTTNVVVPDGVEVIENRAFKDCKSLQNVKLPDSVIEIGDYAFYNCEKLPSIDLPKSLTSIGSYAFSCCESLTSIKIPSGVRKIQMQTFGYCTALTVVHLPYEIILENNAFLDINPIIQYY